MEFNFNEEEICGHLVSTTIKKVWYTELEELQEFDRICKKYNLRYVVFYGTLLGAVRHKGYIPWDDDIDVVMPRTDYNRFLDIAQNELPKHLFLQNAYTDNWIITYSKIRNSNTSAIEDYLKDIDMNHGIFLDVFPMDVAPDTNDNVYGVRRVINDMFSCIFDKENTANDLINNNEKDKYILDREMLITLVKANPSDVLYELEKFAENHYNDTGKCYAWPFEMLKRRESYDKEMFDNIIYVPFEHIMVPIPKNYDSILRQCYGDYMTPVKGGTLHQGIWFDPDKPYMEWFKENGLR